LQILSLPHADARAQLDTIIEELTTLSKRSRRQSQSIFVPMGEGRGYCDQEWLSADLL
jgi:hypothetical protein